MRLSQPAFVRPHGRKLGFLRHVIASMQLRAGLLGAYEDVEWERVRRLVFVCSGNICRSAYAHARARALGLPCASFGLLADQGSPADPVAARVAARRGIDLQEHHATAMSGIELAPDDLLLTFEIAQGRALERLARRVNAQVTLLGRWARPPRPHVEDPFGLGDAYFATCFDVIDDAVARVAAEWRG